MPPPSSNGRSDARIEAWAHKKGSFREMAKSDHPGTWTLLYPALRGLGADTFVTWQEYEVMTGNRGRMTTRSSLCRAREELEAKDGLTLAGQCAEGFWIRAA